MVDKFYTESSAILSRSRHAHRNIYLYTVQDRINHHRSTRLVTRDSAVAEEPHISGTLHWRLSKWIICSWTI